MEQHLQYGLLVPDAKPSTVVMVNGMMHLSKMLNQQGNLLLYLMAMAIRKR